MLTRRASLLLLLLLLFYSLVRYICEQNTQMSIESLNRTLTVSAISILIYMMTEQINPYLKSNFLCSSLIFLIGFVFVHEINYLAVTTGLYSDISGAANVNSRIVNEAAICTSCSLITFLIGCIVCKKPFKGMTISQYVKPFRYIDKWMLILVFIFYFFTDKKFFQSGYATIVNEEGLSLISAVSRNMILGCQFALSSFIIISNNKNLSFLKYVKSYSIIYYIALIIYLYLVLLSGERSPLLILITCYFATFFIVSKIKIKLIWGLLLIAFAVFILNLLTTMRFLGSPYTFDKLLEACDVFNAILSNQSFFFDATKQLSNQVGIYHHMYNVSKDFILYGAGMGYQLLGIIPGLRYVFSLFLDIDTSILSVSQIATRDLNDGSGAGNACEADVIYNWGAYGTMLFFFLFGLFLKKLDMSIYMERPKIFVAILGLAYLSYAIYISRSICLWPLNSCAYAFLFVYIEKIANKRRLLKKE